MKRIYYVLLAFVLSLCAVTSVFAQSENNKIYYTSSDGNRVTPFLSEVFGANIVSNVYEDGQGCITFDGDVTSIGYCAFLNCKRLATITIPNGVTSIEKEAFWNCSSLSSVTIPNSVTSIEYEAFRGCI